MPSKLPEQPKSLDELSFSEFLRRVPLKEFNRDFAPPAVRVPGRVAKWHQRRSIGDPTFQTFNIPGKLTGNKYSFITTMDWAGLLVPLILVAPTDPAHERYKEYNEYRTPDELRGEAEIREAARNLVESYERSEYARNNPEGEPFRKFTAINYLNRPIPFWTRPHWAGLWVHSIYRTSDDMPVEPQNREFRVYKTTEEISGEAAIRLEARKYLQRFDRVITESTQPGRRHRKRKPYLVHLGPRRQSLLADIKSYLSSTLKMPVRDPEVIRWVLDNAWIHLLPDDFKSVPLDESETLWAEPSKPAPNPARLGTKSPDESDAK